MVYHGKLSIYNYPILSYIIIISYMSQDIHLSWDIIHMVVMGYILLGYFMGLMGSSINDILSWGYHGDIMGIFHGDISWGYDWYDEFTENSSHFGILLPQSWTCHQALNHSRKATRLVVPIHPYGGVACATGIIPRSVVWISSNGFKSSVVPWYPRKRNRESWSVLLNSNVHIW